MIGPRLREDRKEIYTIQFHCVADGAGAYFCMQRTQSSSPAPSRFSPGTVDGDRYDFVLMATGFNNHSADVALCRATKAQNLPYVRVQKGRLAATIRALGRAFNVSAQGKEADEATVAHVG